MLESTVRERMVYFFTDAYTYTRLPIGYENRKNAHDIQYYTVRPKKGRRRGNTVCCWKFPVSPGILQTDYSKGLNKKK